MNSDSNVRVGAHVACRANQWMTKSDDPSRKNELAAFGLCLRLPGTAQTVGYCTHKCSITRSIRRRREEKQLTIVRKRCNFLVEVVFQLPRHGNWFVQQASEG